MAIPPNIQNLLIKACHDGGELVAHELVKAVLATVDGRADIKSPIEQLFYGAWIVVENVCKFVNFSLFQPYFAGLEIQVPVTANGNQYRLDFALPEYQIAIELDGHEFHERTKEQVAYRDKRDRDLQLAGWMVLHFSGSAVMTDATFVVSEILGAIGERLRSAKS